MLNITNDSKCPECGSNFVRRSHRRRIEKVMLSILLCFPCRCMDCFCRYYVFRYPFDSSRFQFLWLKLIPGVKLLGLIAVAGVISIMLFFVSNLDNSASSQTKRVSPLLSQHNFNLTTPEVPQASAADLVLPDIVREDPQVSDPPKTHTTEVTVLKTQDTDTIKPGQKMITLKVAAGWVRESFSTNARPKFLLKKHDAVLILDITDGWYLVRLKDGKQGWVHQSLF